MTQPMFMTLLTEEAVAAQNAEITFRNNIAAEIARHEKERQFAFRRINILERMLKAANGAESEADAITAQRAALKSLLGWHADTDARKPILDGWSAVAAAVWHHRSGEPDEVAGPSVPDALRAFEAWYFTEYGAPFLAMLDQEVEELPVVEF